MLVSPTMLEHTRCSVCQTFLSATPVKVYFSRELRCARCLKEDDGGVISSLYSSVSKYLRYPCRNYLAGCKEILANFEVISHENKCEFCSKYVCSFCVTEDSDLTVTYDSYDLSRHVKENHCSAVLKYPNFHINTNFDQQCAYVYIQASSLFFLHCSFDAFLQEVTFSIKCLAENSNATYKFTLHSTDDICQYSKNNKCLTYEQTEFNKTNSAKIISKNYPDNKIFCKFEFIENGGLVLLHHLPICKDETFKKTIICTFENFSKLGFDLADQSLPYFIGENTWTVEIRKSGKLQSLGIYFGAQDFRKSYTVHVTISLYSCQPDKQIVRTFTHEYSENATTWGWINFIPLEKVLNPVNGYIHSDTLKVKVGFNPKIETKATCESPVHVCQNTTW